MTGLSQLTPAQEALAQRATEFAEQVVQPIELESELAGGPISVESQQRIRSAALEAGLQGGLHRTEDGGNSWTHLEWFLVEEAFGRTTNAVSWYVPNAYNVWRAASPALKERWLHPALRGELHDAYAVTEAGAGSDPSMMTSTATKVDGGWLINGEKWFVTFGDVAEVIVLNAWALPDGPDGPRVSTLFAVPADSPGIAVVDDPVFTHNYPHGHPTLSFTDVRVNDADVIGDVGAGDDLQRSWFVEERLGIAARCGGAMQRLLQETVDWAAAREQGGARLLDHQGISFPLAESATDAAAGRLLSLEVARLYDAGADPKLVHGKASMAKLFCSEAAYRCADRAVQVFGGRGYMRTNTAERYWRELRVDRIWEGSSEIQKIIVARALEKRGVSTMLT